MAKPIHLLSAEVRSQIRSGIALPSLTQCVEELVANALDAGANCIAVRVNLKIFRVQVVDNGCGIPEDQLHLLGERYATSKCHTAADLDDLRYFGYRGEAVASIRDAAAVVEIVSKVKGSDCTHCKIFRKGVALPVTEAAVPRPSAGTTVTVHDLFYSLAVRRRGFNPGLEMERLCYRLQAIALMWPNVSLSLRSDDTTQVLLQTKKCSEVLGVFAALFGETQSSNLRPVSLDSGHFGIQGYLGREGHGRKDLQFLFINHRPVLNTKLHKTINAIFSKTSIFHRRSRNPLKHAAEAASSNSSPTKYGDKFPVFVIDIECPYTEYDITFGPTKTLVEFRHWDPLLEAIEKVTTEFLKSENLILADKDKGKTTPDEKVQEPKPPETASEVSLEKEEEERVEESVYEHSDSDWNSLADKMILERGKEYGDGISVTDHPRGLFSRTVVRPRDGTQKESADCSAGPDSQTLGRGSSSRQRDEDAGSHTDAGDAHVRGSTFSPTAAVAATDDAGDAEDAECHDESQEVPGAIREPFTVVRDKTSCPNATCVEEKSEKAEKSKDSADKENSLTTCGFPSSGLHDVEDASMVLKPSVNNGSVERTSSEIRNPLQKPPPPVFSSDKNSGVHLSANETVKHDAELCQNEEAPWVKGQPLHLADRTGERGTHGHHSSEVEHDATSTTQKHSSSTASGENSAPELHGFREAQRNHDSVSHLTSESLAEVPVSGKNDLPGTAENCQGDGRGKVRGQVEACGQRQASMHSTLGPLRRRAAPAGDALRQPASDAISSKLRKLQQRREKSTILTSTLQQFRSHLGSRQHGATTSLRDADRKSCSDAGTSRLADSSSRDASRAESKKSCAASMQGNSAGHAKLLSTFLLPDVSHMHAQELRTGGVDGTAQNANDHIETVSQPVSMEHSGGTSQAGAGPEAGTAAPEFCCRSHQNSHDALLCRVGAPDDFVPEHDRERRTEKRSSSIALETVCCKHRRPGHADEGCDCLGDGRNDLATVEGERDARSTVHAVEMEKRQFVTSDSFVQTFERKEVHKGQELCVPISSHMLGPSLNDRGLGNHQTSSSFQSSDVFLQTLSGETGNAFKPFSSGVSEPCQVSSHQTPDLRRFDMTEILIQTPSRFLKHRQTVPVKVGSSDGSADIFVPRNIAQPSNNVIAQLSNNVIAQTSNKVIAQPSNNVIVQPSNNVIVQPSNTASGEKNESVFVEVTTEPVVEFTRDMESKGVEAMEEPLNVLQEPLPEDESLNVPRVGLEHSLMEPEPAPIDKDMTDLQILSSDPENDFGMFASTQPFLVSTVCDKPVTSDIDSPDTTSRHDSDMTEQSLNQEGNSSPQVGDNVSLSSIPDDPSIPDASKNITPEPTFGTSHRGSPSRSLADPLAIPQPIVQAEVACADCSVASELPTECLSSAEEPPNESEDAACSTVAGSAADVAGMDDNTQTVDEEGDECDGTRKTSVGDPGCLENQLPETAFAAGWTKVADPSLGCEVYVNLATGHTCLPGQKVPPSALMAVQSASESSPEKFHAETERGADGCGTEMSTNARNEAVAGLVEQHRAAAEAVSCKWKDPAEAAACKNPGADESYIEQLLSTWENPVFARPQESEASCKSAMLVAKKAQLPQQFHKGMLKNFQVVGQVDNKFLACVIGDGSLEKTSPSSSPLLVMIDQHAAHERIRLERDYVEVYEDREKRIIKRSIVDPPHRLTLPEGDIRVLENFREEFHRIGVQFHRDLEDRRVIYLETLPACTVSIEPNPLRAGSREPLAIDIVETLIKEYVQTLRCSRGALGRMPLTLHEVLCNHACRGAIKFGEKLSRTRCVSLMAALGRCTLPFQCAHGRPSIVPLLDLTRPLLGPPEQKDPPPRLWRLKTKMAASPERLRLDDV